MDDRQIIALYFARAESAITETAKKYGRLCFTVSDNILRDKNDAEECVNDAYLKTWDSIPPNDPPSLSAYIVKIVRNISLNRKKAKGALKRGSGEYESAYEELEEVVSSVQTTEDAADELFLRDIIDRWLGTLSADQRAVFVGRYWYFDPIPKIASRMGFSVGKTKTLLFRLRKDLREYLIREGVQP